MKFLLDANVEYRLIAINTELAYNKRYQQL